MTKKKQIVSCTDQEPTASREPLKHAWLGFAGIWIITATCVVTDLVVLHKPQFLITVLFILFFMILAHKRVRVARTSEDD